MELPLILRYIAARKMNTGYSLKIARVFGIEIRLHWTLLLYAAFVLLLPWPQSNLDIAIRVAAVGLLFLSVLLHEFGHSFAARFCHGESDLILLWPLGGLAFVRLPNSPAAHFLTTLAGPAVTAALWLGAELFIPLTNGWTNIFLHELAAMNFWMLLFNLIPAYPLDGGRMLHATLWRTIGYGRATWICVNLGLGLGVLMFIASFFFHTDGTSTRAHVMLAAAAGFVIFESWQRRQMLRYEEMNEEHWSTRPGIAHNHPYRTETETKQPFGKKLFGWKAKAEKPKRAKRALSKEEFIEREVNPILEKISKQGMASLTPRERQILDEAGKRMSERVER